MRGNFCVAGLLVSVCGLAACGRGATTAAAPTSPGASSAGVSVSGMVRESGAQALGGVTVRAVGNSESAQTDGRGVYRLTTASRTSLEFTKPGYEMQRLGEFEFNSDATIDVQLQRIITIGPDERIAAAIYADDGFYAVASASGDMCGPCKVIRLQLAGTADVDVHIRWEPSVSVSLVTWIAGASRTGTSEITFTANMAAGETAIYVGARNREWTKAFSMPALPFEISTSPRSSAR
jgi:hypothetical protein